MPTGDPIAFGLPCSVCGCHHTTSVCPLPAFNPSVACAPMPSFGPTLIIENGIAKCGAGCASLPCSHFPHWFDTSSKISDSDVERIARRVVELLAPRLPLRVTRVPEQPFSFPEDVE